MPYPADFARRTSVGVLGALLALPIPSACADRPNITFSNHRDYPVTVYVGGDRVLILAPHSSEGLHYMAAAWTWPRRIQIREYGTDRILSEFRAL